MSWQCTLSKMHILTLCLLFDHSTIYPHYYRDKLGNKLLYAEVRKLMKAHKLYKTKLSWDLNFAAKYKLWRQSCSLKCASASVITIPSIDQSPFRKNVHIFFWNIAIIIRILRDKRKLIIQALLCCYSLKKLLEVPGFYVFIFLWCLVLPGTSVWVHTLILRWTGSRTVWRKMLLVYLWGNEYSGLLVFINVSEDAGWYFVGVSLGCVPTSVYLFVFSFLTWFSPPPIGPWRGCFLRSSFCVRAGRDLVRLGTLDKVVVEGIWVLLYFTV